MTTAVINNSLPFQRTETFVNGKNLKLELIKEVALTTLKELAITIAFSIITCAFIATPAGVTLLIGAGVTLIALNIFFRTVSAACAYQCYHLKKSGDHPKQLAILSTLREFTQFLAPVHFAFFDVMTRDVLVHEGGHAIAASLLYKNAHPKIEVSPFSGGVTKYHAQTLSELGQKVGKHNAALITSAAGAGLSLGSALLSIFAAHQMRKSHPLMAKYLICMALLSIFQHAAYALSALQTSSNKLSGHDFAALAAGGIHPVASAAFIIGVPLLLKISLFATDYFRNKFSNGLIRN